MGRDHMGFLEFLDKMVSLNQVQQLGPIVAVTFLCKYVCQLGEYTQANIRTATSKQCVQNKMCTHLFPKFETTIHLHDFVRIAMTSWAP